MYKDHFIKAIERTYRLKISLDSPLVDSSETYIVPGVYEDLKRLLITEFPDFHSGSLAFNCHKVSYYMKSVLEKYFGTELYLTIGYITMEAYNYFSLDQEKISALLNRTYSIDDKVIPFHVWLTLPSLEIIDFTFGQSFASNSEEQIPLNEFLFRHPDNLIGSLKYIPVLIGEDFLSKIGVLKEEFTD